MPTRLPLLLSVCYIVVAGLFRALSTPTTDIDANDFNFGVEAALASALFFSVDASSSHSAFGDGPSWTRQTVAWVAMLSLPLTAMLTRHCRSIDEPGRSLRYWAYWLSSNALGALCLFLTLSVRV